MKLSPPALIFSALVAAATVLAGAPAAWSAEPIHIALSAPLTGNFAEYGQNFQKAIDLGVEWINAAGGIKGRPIVMVVGDSRADPKEAAALAQKFTSDSRIVAEIGDFSSTACLAAQPIYDRAGMVQLSPTASHPNFAPGSPWSFGIVGTQAGEGPYMARYAVQKLGKKRLAVLYINNDWGIVSKDLFIKAAKEDPKHHFTVADQPDAGPSAGGKTLVLETAIVQLVPSKAVLQALGFVSWIPTAVMLGGSTLSQSEDQGKGVVAIEARVRDAASGQVVGMFADREHPPTAIIDIKSINWWAPARKIIDNWASQFIATANGKKPKNSSNLELLVW